MKQVKGIYWFGALKNVYGEAATYIQAVQFAIICIMAYTTTINPWLVDNGIILPIWSAIILFVLFISGIILFAYVIGIPSHYTFLKRQFRDHGNFTHDDMELILQNQKRIMEKLGIDDGV